MSRNDNKPIAKVLIFDAKGRLLVLYRSPSHPKWPEAADFPGGNVEGTESPIDATLREIKEETGLTIKNDDLRLMLKREVDGREHLIYRVELDGLKPEVKLSWEHGKYAWIEVSNLPKFHEDIDDPFYQTVHIALEIS